MNIFKTTAKRIALAALSAMAILSLSISLLTSCNSDSGRVTIDGRLLNMNQADFLVYSYDGAIAGVDTIHVKGGRFTYEKSILRDGTLVIVFPNFKTIPVFVKKGCSIDIDGNAAQLKEMKVTGTEENKTFTEWRKNTDNLSPKDLETQAKKFIDAHADSPISRWMRMQYVTYDVKPTIGDRLPSFNAVDVNGIAVNESKLLNGNAVIIVWSSWNYDSQNMLRRIAYDIRENKPDAIKNIVTICIDADPKVCKKSLKSQNAENIQTICDGMMLESPLLKTLGITTFPANIKLKDGKVTGRNLPNDKLL